MNLISKITNFIFIQQLKFFVKGLISAMVISANIAHESNPGRAYYSDYAAIALSTRPGWKEKNKNEFYFKNVNLLTIDRKDSTYNVIIKVADIEVKEMFKDDPQLSSTLRQEALNIIQKHFKIKLK